MAKAKKDAVTVAGKPQDDDQALLANLRKQAAGGDMKALELWGRLKDRDWWSRPSTAGQKLKPISEATARRLVEVVRVIETADLPEQTQVAKALLVLAESASKDQLTAAGLKASDLDLQRIWIREREEKLRTLEADETSEVKVKLPRQLGDPDYRPTRVRRQPADPPTPTLVEFPDGAPDKAYPLVDS